jgi:hypothetical protein
MTENRAQAYGRIVGTLRAVGHARLWPPEEDCIREAADALLFCDDIWACGPWGVLEYVAA